VIAGQPFAPRRNSTRRGTHWVTSVRRPPDQSQLLQPTQRPRPDSPRPNSTYAPEGSSCSSGVVLEVLDHNLR